MTRVFILNWQGWQDLNPQHPDLEAGALPIELHPFDTGYLVQLLPEVKSFSNLSRRGSATTVIGEALAIDALGPNPVYFPRLAHLTAGPAIAGSSALVIHGPPRRAILLGRYLQSKRPGIAPGPPLRQTLPLMNSLIRFGIAASKPTTSRTPPVFPSSAVFRVATVEQFTART